MDAKRNGTTSSPESGFPTPGEHFPDADAAVPAFEPDVQSAPRASWTQIVWQTLGARIRAKLRSRRMLAFTAVGAVVVAMVTASWWWTCGWHSCPTPAQLRAWRPTEGGTLHASDGERLSALSPVRRVNVPLTRVPAQVQAAFIAVEDRRFRTHHGIDWRGVGRAAFKNVVAGGVREGASTITMQLARNVFLGNRAAERSFGRKLLETRYAGLIEKALTKDEILERYLNAIYLGNGVYGVEGASRDLFGKGVRDVTLSEAAMLAGLPKAPSSYSPRRDRARALARRSIVLEVLEREQVATSAELRQARNAPLRVTNTNWVPTRTVDSWAVEAARQTLDSLRALGVIPRALNDAQLTVWSTVNRDAQRAAERAVASGAWSIDQERVRQGQNVRRANDRTQGALVALDPATGAVRAIVGGRRMERKGFHRALRAKRQPGSTFKPFVYAAALQHGFTAASMLDDEPVSVDIGRDVWTPANYGDAYAGRITLRDALARSANAATVRMSRDVGMPAVAALAHAQGITSELPVVPALALGAGAVTPMELTAAYAPFANGGLRVEPYLVTRVDDAFGRVLWQRPDTRTARVLDAVDAFLVTSLLQSVVDRGTGNAVRAGGVRGPVAGKTGTTNDGTDVWFVGYTPTLVASLWFGADDPQPLGWNASGGRLAAPWWAKFVREGWPTSDADTAWAPPPGVVTRQIDVGTGKLASDWCGPARREYFRAGTQPTAVCEMDDVFFMPPDWHEPSDTSDEIDEAVGGILEALGADPKARRAAQRAIDELRRAAEREKRREKTRQRMD